MKSKYHSKVIIGTWSLSGDFGKISKKNIYSSLEQALKKIFLNMIQHQLTVMEVLKQF